MPSPTEFIKRGTVLQRSANRPYSQDLAQFELRIFAQMKIALRGHRRQTVEYILQKRQYEANKNGLAGWNLKQASKWFNRLELKANFSAGNKRKSPVN